MPAPCSTTVVSPFKARDQRPPCCCPAFQVLDARARAANEYWSHFLDQLSSTVR